MALIHLINGSEVAVKTLCEIPVFICLKLNGKYLNLYLLQGILKTRQMSCYTQTNKKWCKFLSQ